MRNLNIYIFKHVYTQMYISTQIMYVCVYKMCTHRLSYIHYQETFIIAFSWSRLSLSHTKEQTTDLLNNLDESGINDIE